MALKYGNTTVTALKYGSTNVTTGKYGSTTVFSAGATPTLSAPSVYMNTGDSIPGNYGGVFVIVEIQNPNSVAVTAHIQGSLYSELYGQSIEVNDTVSIPARSSYNYEMFYCDDPNGDYPPGNIGYTVDNVYLSASGYNNSSNGVPTGGFGDTVYDN